MYSAFFRQIQAKYKLRGCENNVHSGIRSLRAEWRTGTWLHLEIEIASQNWKSLIQKHASQNWKSLIQKQKSRNRKFRMALLGHRSIGAHGIEMCW